jgi:hypothetical protein
LPGARAQLASRPEELRLLVQHGQASVKVEVSPVLRGTVHPVERRRGSQTVEEEFGFAEMQLVAFEDLYGGKLVAALDRQHPRDLYDVKQLLDAEGISDDLFRTFLVYVASSSRPPHELIAPRFLDMGAAYRSEFEGMTVHKVTLAELEETRERLTEALRATLGDAGKRFLLSLHDAEPDFVAIGRPQAAQRPAIRWKLQNLARLRQANSEKHRRLRAAIEAL